jgi:hypothetical protein
MNAPSRKTRSFVSYIWFPSQQASCSNYHSPVWTVCRLHLSDHVADSISLVVSHYMTFHMLFQFSQIIHYLIFVNISILVIVNECINGKYLMFPCTSKIPVFCLKHSILVFVDTSISLIVNEGIGYSPAHLKLMNLVHCFTQKF